jgi:hypothetical protein
MASTAKAVSGKPRKSPLRADTGSHTARDAVPAPGRRIIPGGKGKLSATDLRQLAISEFAAWLREQTNKFDRPFQEHTITNYTDAARTLDRWMTAEKIDEDFTVCDTAMLNRFFARYLKTHTQGGTNTLQRNLAHLFAWLDEVYNHPNPYTARLNRYAPTKKRPATLAEDFIKDMLEVTGGGKARSFEDVRDHAIIRVFTEGGTRVQRGPHRPVHAGDGSCCRRLPAGAPLACSSGTPRAVARDPGPGTDDRVRRVPDAQAPGCRGWIRPKYPPSSISSHFRPRLARRRRIGR